MSFDRASVDFGGLMIYGPDAKEMYRQAGIYAARILKGEKPADLPVIQPSKFELAINLKTAKAQGINVPLQVQHLADAIIEYPVLCSAALKRDCRIVFPNGFPFFSPKLD